MNTKKNHVILNVIALFIVFFALFGAVGSLEYADDLFYSIPERAVEEIRAKMGDDATRPDIVKEYLSDKGYYDNIGFYGASEISQIYNAE